MRQDVLLALPLHVVCSEECQGLCPDAALISTKQPAIVNPTSTRAGVAWPICWKRCLKEYLTVPPLPKRKLSKGLPIGVVPTMRSGLCTLSNASSAEACVCLTTLVLTAALTTVQTVLDVGAEEK